MVTQELFCTFGLPRYEAVRISRAIKCLIYYTCFCLLAVTACDAGRGGERGFAGADAAGNVVYQSRRNADRAERECAGAHAAGDVVQQARFQQACRKTGDGGGQSGLCGDDPEARPPSNHLPAQPACAGRGLGASGGAQARPAAR